MGNKFLILLTALLLWLKDDNVNEAALPLSGPSFGTQNYTETSPTAIGISITTAGTNAKLWRDGELAIDDRSGNSLLVDGAEITDNYYILDNPGSGLTPGTEYEYILRATEGNSPAATMCTKPATPQGVRAVADGYDMSETTGKAIIYMTNNFLNGDSVLGFLVTENDDTAVTTSHADTDPTVTSVEVTGLTLATSYTFKVVQQAKCGGATAVTELASDEVLTNAITTGPVKPVFTTAQSPTADSTAIVITLTTFTNLMGYEHVISRDGEKVGTIVFDAALMGTATFDDTGLTPGTEYDYVVTSTDTNDNGGSSITSDTVSGCTKPDPPSSGSFTATDTTYTINLVAPSGGVVNYIIDGTPTSDASTTETVNMAVTANTKYTVQVKTNVKCPAPSTDLESTDSLSITVYTAPAQPTFVKVDALSNKQQGVTTIGLNWNGANPEITDANLQVKFKWNLIRSTGSTGVWDVVFQDLAYAEEYYSDENLTPATEYKYQLKAYFDVSESQPSMEKTVCTYPTPPEQVVTTTVSDTEIGCSWTRPSGNGDAIDGYVVTVNQGTATPEMGTSVTLDSAGDFSSDVITNGINYCRVQTKVTCTGADTTELLSEFAEATGYFAPNAPTVTIVKLNSTSLQVEVTPVFTARNPTTEGMIATIYRGTNDNAIATVDTSPFVYVDTNLEPGKLYSYKASVTTNDNPSALAAAAQDCTYPQIPPSMEQLSETDAAITVFVSSPTGDWETLKFYKDGTAEAAEESKVAGTTEYEYEFSSGVSEATCYTLGVESVVTCASSPLASQNRLEIQGCSKPTTPSVTVAAGDVGEMEVSFSVTFGNYKYHLWRGATAAAEELKLDTDSVDDGLFTDTFQITPGDVYCYVGAVEVNGIISEKSTDEKCVCSKPNPVTNLEVTSRTDTSFMLQWTLPEGTFGFTEIELNGNTEEVTEPTMVLDTSTDFTGLNPNTQYTITAKTLVKCSKPTTDTPVYAPATSISEFTLAEQPVIYAETSIDDPTAITITLQLANSPAIGYQYVLEREGVKIQGTLQNPHVDAGLEPATSYRYTGYLIGHSGEASAASDTIKFGTHPVEPVGVSQTDATTTGATIGWSSPANRPTGYYLAFGDIAASLASPTTATDQTPLLNTDRRDEFQTALAAATVKIDATSSDVDGGSTLEPASDYQVGVTACIDYTDLTNFDSVTSAYVNLKLEMCSPYASITVHTKPEQPDCSVDTENATKLQLTITAASADVQPGTFTVSRNDLNYNYLIDLNPTESPYTISDLTPSTEYTFTVATVYQGQESATFQCSGCTQPALPTNFQGSYLSDPSEVKIEVTWDEPQGDVGAVTGYQVQLGADSFVDSDQDYSHTFDTTNDRLAASTCYDISIRAKFTCDSTDLYSDVVTEQICTQPAVCVVSMVVPPDVAVTDYQFKLEVQLTTIADHTYNIYRDGELVIEDLVSTSTSNVDTVDLSGSRHCYKCTATKNSIESSLDDATEFCSCSRPGPPDELNYQADSDASITVTWAAPQLNRAYTDFELQKPDGTSVPNLGFTYQDTTGLDESTAYVYQVRTSYTCAETGGPAALESDWASVTAYTAPSTPILSVQQETTSSITLDVANSGSYANIRLYQDNIEVEPTAGIPVASWPYTVDGLVAGTRYMFSVIVFNSENFYAESNSIHWCTKPKPLVNLQSEPRFFYGFKVSFERPESGLYDTFEVQSEVDSDEWRVTTDSNSENQLYYYYYNMQVAKDYTRTKGQVDTTLGISFPGDLAYEVGRQVNSLASSTTYTINARSTKTCSVNSVSSTTTTANQVFYSDQISGSGFAKAHPVIDIVTQPLSQTTIQVSFKPFEEQDGFTYKIYRYKNGSSTIDFESAALTIDQIPFVDGTDSPLEPATLYTYEIGVIYQNEETFEKDRLQLEREYWPGNYNEAPSDDYATDPNREARWRPFESQRAPNPSFDPTFKNANNDASGQHNIFHFYYKEKTACTFPPKPSTIGQELDTHTSTKMTWDVVDLSSSGTMVYSGKNINITTYLYINGVVMHELKNDYSTSNSYVFTEDSIGALAAKTAYTCEVDIGLACPDDLVYFDEFDYNSAPTFDTVNQVWESGPLKSDVYFKASNNLLASNSATDPGRQSVKCWTRPTPVQITSVQPGTTDDTTETTQLVIEYTTPDTGVTFEVEVDKDMTPPHSTTPDAADWTNPQEETTTRMNFGGLKPPGHTFDVKIRSYWEDGASGKMYSLYSPEQLDTALPANIPALTENAQSVYTDPILGCTAPLPPTTVAVEGVSAETISYTVTNPNGVLAGYQYEYSYDGVVQGSIAFANPVEYLVADETVSGEISSLPSCKEITVAAKSVSTCGVIPDSANVASQSATESSGYTKPLPPSFTPDASLTDSKEEITLVFDHDNDASCSVTKYDIYRDGEHLTSGAPLTAKTFQDTGLTAGTVYQYEATMTANGEESLRSNNFSICTNPDPPTNAVKKERQDGRSLAIEWTPPAVGQVTGYFVNHNLQGTHENVVTGFNSLTYPRGLDYGTEYTVDITVVSYLECEVTGVLKSRKLRSDTSLTATVVIGTAPTLPVLLPETSSGEEFSFSVAFSAGKVDRVQLESNEPLESPPTSDQGTFQVIDPTTNLEFEFTTSDASVIAPVFTFNFTNLKIDTRYWFAVTGIFDGSQSSNSRGPKNQIMYIHRTPAPDDSIMGVSPPMFAIVLTGMAVTGAGVAALVVFGFVKGAPVFAAKMSAMITPAQPAQAQAPVTEVEPFQPPKENLAYQLKLKHTQQLANRILE